MATADDMELWCTTEGLGIECDDVEIREEFPANTPVQEEGVAVLPAGPHSHSLKDVPADCREAESLHLASLSDEQDSTRDRREQPAEGVRLPSPAQTIHPNHQHGSQLDEAGEGQGIALCSSGVGPQTACDWLRNIGVFLDCGDL